MKIKTSVFMTVCVAFIISFLCIYFNKDSASAVDETSVLTVWQVDSFEGGKGSRADFLQNVGNELSKKENCYINVVSLSAEAARLNLSNGNIPDIISYGAGMCGVEGYITDYTVWCRGGYCLFCLDANCDFSDLKAENTVINKGKDNYATIAALFCGIQDAKFESSTSAYVKLINGEYKYLLGTQRDIFRLKTRNAAFSLKPLTEFNDLYQIISKTTHCQNNGVAQKYIDCLLSKSSEINKIGMFSDGAKLYEDEMSACENIKFDYQILYPINEAMKSSLESGILQGDINMLKAVLK